jgi:hypothetical protein
LVGSVVYPDKGAYGCQAFDGGKPFKSKGSRPTVLLLDRGGINKYITHDYSLAS